MQGIIYVAWHMAK